MQTKAFAAAQDASRQDPIVSGTRSGFTLVEVVVAMVLLATVLVMLAGMTFATAQRSLDLQSTGARQAAMLQVVNRINATSFDVLNGTLYPGASAYCDTIDAGSDDFQVCVTVTERAARLLRLQVVLTDDRTGVSDTMTLSRTRS